MQGNSVQGISGYDPYLIAALNSYNVNFQRAQNSQAVAAQTPAQTGSNMQALSNLPRADYSESSNTGIWVTGALMAATLAGCMIKGKNGNPIDGAKKILGSIKKCFSSEGSKAAETAAKSAPKIAPAKPLETIRIKVNDKGKVEYYIPGKTTKPIEDPATIEALVQSDKELKKLTGLRFNSGETTINGATFTLEDNGIKNTIEFSGDKIIKISNGKDDITSTFVEAGKLKSSFSDINDAQFASRIEDYIAKIRGGNWEVISDKNLALKDINYTTRIGDNVAEVTRKGISTRLGKPTITKLTTLKKFDSNDTEVIAYIQRAKQDGIDLGAIINDKFTVKGKLPKGFKIEKFDLQCGSDTLHVVDGEVVGITIKGKTYGKNHDNFLAYMYKHEEGVNRTLQNALKDNNVPNGAIIVPA